MKHYHRLSIVFILLGSSLFAKTVCAQEIDLFKMQEEQDKLERAGAREAAEEAARAQDPRR